MEQLDTSTIKQKRNGMGFEQLVFFSLVAVILILLYIASAIKPEVVVVEKIVEKEYTWASIVASDSLTGLATICFETFTVIVVWQLYILLIHRFVSKRWRDFVERYLPGTLGFLYTAYAHTYPEKELWSAFTPWKISYNNPTDMVCVLFYTIFFSWFRIEYHVQMSSGDVKTLMTELGLVVVHVLFLCPTLFFQCAITDPGSSYIKFGLWWVSHYVNILCQLFLYYRYFLKLFPKLSTEDRDLPYNYGVFFFNLNLISGLTTFSRFFLINEEKAAMLFNYEGHDFVRIIAEYIIYCAILDIIGFSLHWFQHYSSSFWKQASHEHHHWAKHPTAIEGVATDTFDFMHPLLSGLVARILTDKLFPKNTWIETMMRLSTAEVWCLCQHYGLDVQFLNIAIWAPGIGSTIFGEHTIYAHDLHHQLGDCNYGYTAVWDKVFGTYNDGRDRRSRRFVSKEMVWYNMSDVDSESIEEFTKKEN